MATNDCVPFFDDGDTITATASGAITGKTLVVVHAARAAGLIVVATAGAGAHAFAVAARDAADGANLTLIRPGAIVPVTAAASLSAGAAVKANASGKLVAATAGAYAVGTIVDDVASGADAMLDFAPFSVPA